jgi:hypothetical protein
MPWDAPGLFSQKVMKYFAIGRNAKPKCILGYAIGGRKRLVGKSEITTDRSVNSKI